MLRSANNFGKVRTLAYKIQLVTKYSPEFLPRNESIVCDKQIAAYPIFACISWNDTADQYFITIINLSVCIVVYEAEKYMANERKLENALLHAIQYNPFCADYLSFVYAQKKSQFIISSLCATKKT